MRSASSFLVTSTFLLSACVASASPHLRRGPTAPHGARSRNLGHSINAHLAASRPGITSERATEIQNALIKAGYLSGTPSGVWDASSQTAMEKLQSDNGWQTKLVPDSRAIIKLGLGPNAAASAPQTAAKDAHEGVAQADPSSHAPLQ